MMSFEGTRDLGDVRQRLAGYLGANVANLNVLASGWETTVFEFALNTPSLEADLPAGRLMVLRFYQGSNAAEKGPREYRVLCALAKSGYPAPRAYLFESALELFGVPFLIMDRSQGGPLLQLKSFPQAFKIFSLAFFDFVRAHAALHRLDPLLLDFAGIQRPFGTPSASSSATLLDRMLDTIAYRIEVGPLPGLAPMLEWARAQVPRFPCPRDSILHLDYHPQNAVVRGLRVTGILDWVNTDVGDRHLDVGTTCAILATSAMERPRWMRRNVAGNTLRKIFASLYLALYHPMAPVDFARLRYYQAVAAMQRLSMFGMMHTRGPESVGFRPQAISEVTPAVVGLLSRYAARKSGIPVSF